MRDRRWDWALGATNAADRQAQEDVEIGDSVNSLLGGSKAESSPARDWDA